MTLASTTDRPDGGNRSAPASTAVDRPKTLLFCPCGREAAPAEWRVERDRTRRRLVCPDCGETITVR